MSDATQWRRSYKNVIENINKITKYNRDMANYDNIQFRLLKEKQSIF